MLAGRELQPARCGHVGAPHLAYDSGECTMAEAVFHHGKHVPIIARLDKQRAIRGQPDLLEARTIEVEAGDRPNYDPACQCRPRSYSSEEQSRGRIVGQPGRCRGNLMECRARKPCTGEPNVQIRHVEWKYASAAHGHTNVRDPRAKPIDQLWSRRGGLHQVPRDSYVLSMFRQTQGLVKHENHLAGCLSARCSHLPHPSEKQDGRATMR